jgi:hypothetical protein
MQMSQFNRWNHDPDVAPQGDEFLASSSAFPGVFGEGETREEAIESFWQMVELIGELARAPDWPHDRSPYVEPWESVDDDDFADDEDDPFADVGDDEELPEDAGGAG